MIPGRARPRAWTALVLGAAALSTAPASAETSAKPAPRTQIVDGPCAGCRAVFPAGSEPAPLLVILHGDSGHGPADLLAAWERHAASRDVALLALQCPRDLGCKGSWWQWNGDPSWVAAQVDALAKRRPLDRERTWLAGWSGGASYMGLRATALERAFAALVYHGGGIPPRAGCSSDAPRGAPVYFLVGTANPLHSLAVRLREHHEACKDDVAWQVLPGADHAAEWRALDANGGRILDWLSKQRRAPSKG